MPIKEGLETIMALRAGGTVPKIIAVSGGGRMRNLDFLHAAKELGADRVLPKPVQRELLLSTIAEVVGS
jgi:CheY-like chemotaxis protein